MASMPKDHISWRWYGFAVLAIVLQLRFRIFILQMKTWHYRAPKIHVSNNEIVGLEEEDEWNNTYFWVFVFFHNNALGGTDASTFYQAFCVFRTFWGCGRTIKFLTMLIIFRRHFRICLFINIIGFSIIMFFIGSTYTLPVN